VQSHYNSSLDGTKTLGPRSAELVTALYDHRKPIFTMGDVRDLTGAQPSAACSLVGKMVRRGLATRLKGGLFLLVPFELGRERQYLGNPYLVARALAGGDDYYLSHASAMEIHGMTTQPRLVIYTTSWHSFRGRTILGTEFKFVLCRKSDFFGVIRRWVDKTEQVAVSDLERTVIDGLKQPTYCGGFSEVAKGFWMRRSDVDIEKLVGYALRLDVGAVIRRLGFLLETSSVDAPQQIERLQRKLTATYHLLDPTLPAEGRRVARWRLRLNVTPDELVAARNT
jgi:predicted transcriptional regulator of viral defense system